MYAHFISQLYRLHYPIFFFSICFLLGKLDVCFIVRVLFIRLWCVKSIEHFERSSILGVGCHYEYSRVSVTTSITGEWGRILVAFSLEFGFVVLPVCKGLV